MRPILPGYLSRFVLHRIQIRSLCSHMLKLVSSFPKTLGPNVLDANTPRVFLSSLSKVTMATHEPKQMMVE